MRGANLSYSMADGRWPCMDCKNRTVGCHAKCEAYNSHKAANQVILDKVWAETQASKAAYDVLNDKFDREDALYSKRCQQRGVRR